MSSSCLYVENMQFNMKFMEQQSSQQPQETTTTSFSASTTKQQTSSVTTTSTTTTTTTTTTTNATCNKTTNKFCATIETIDDDDDDYCEKYPSSGVPMVQQEETKTNLCVYEQRKMDLIEKLNQNQLSVLSARDEYLKQYENFLSIARRFYEEKYVNLKLSFKNQVLKQQIYFESELFEISREFKHDYEHNIKKLCGLDDESAKKIKSIAQKYLKLSKIDMRKLLDYMKNALMNSYDTLIEAYETCHVLKMIEKIQNNVITSSSSEKLQQIPSYNRSTSSSSSSSSSSETSSDEEVDEQLELVKYRQEVDNLMHILDEIEVQYLQRKDQTQKRSKLYFKLKSKLKYIENKYDNLSKDVNKLKYEKCVYKQLVHEKDRLKPQQQQQQQQQQSIDTLDTTTAASENNDHNVIMKPCESELALLVKNTTDTTNEMNTDGEYNRKLYLLSNLINLHKTKHSNSLTLRNYENKKSNARLRKTSYLHIYECTCDGDLVAIENCNLKTDFDISNWSITRQIDNMPMVTYKIPDGSIIKCGKVINVKTLFNDQLDFLFAIKQSIENSCKKFCLKINTKLVSPDGKIEAVHTQEIPQFYNEIFKYANLIKFI